MTPEQKAMVRDSFIQIIPNSERMTARFYARLFEIEPTVRPLFENSIRSQGRKFIETLQTVVDLLDRLEQVVPVAWQMGRRHREYGVQDRHYDIVREALLWTLKQELGEAFTPALRSAWQEVYDLLAVTMKQAAAEAARKND